MKDRKKAAWTACFVWMGVIFAMSAMPGDVSGAQSGSITELVLEVVSVIAGEHAQSIARHSVEFFVRKGAHMAEYAVLLVLYRRALRLSGAGYAGIKALFLCVLYAATDEFHQHFVEGRGPAAADVVIDAAGAAIGWGIAAAAERIRGKMQKTEASYKQQGTP